ncbi:Crp/Fnr family transcriptional regulator [Jatrophihabitans sp. DSM 45814]
MLRTALFQGVEPGDVDLLVRQFDLIDIPRHAVLFRQGEPSDALYVLISGKVKLAMNSASGRELLVEVVGPGEQFGEMSVLDPGPRAMKATMISDARVARLPKEALYKWIGSRPEARLLLLQAVARRLRRRDSMMADLYFVDVPGRVAGALLQLADRFGVPEGDHLRVAHGLSQQEIGDLVGATREPVNRALADFGKRGWLHHESKTTLILDREKLRLRSRSGADS